MARRDPQGADGAGGLIGTSVVVGGGTGFASVCFLVGAAEEAGHASTGVRYVGSFLGGMAGMGLGAYLGYKLLAPKD